MKRSNRLLIVLLSATLCLPASVMLAQEAPGALRTGIAELSAGATSIDWRPLVQNDGFVLTVSAPDGKVYRQEFEAGKTPTFGVFDRQGNHRPEGVYTWELTAVPALDKGTREELRSAREAGSASALLSKLQKSGKLPKEALVQSGTFAIQGGALVTPGQFGEAEGDGLHNQTAQQLNNVTAEDVVYADDLIVQRSLCVGFDCVNGEVFGFDTIRMKENNTRIKFEDTSTSAGFATTDWQLTANDSASGGLNKFSIEDITSAKVPFTVEGGATTNSIYVGSTGRVGFRTSTPVLDLHVSTSNTPGIRLEQTNAGGFTAQTWDVAGNEANFFVRDVTGGSRLPLRIRPGAPTSSIDIGADGQVGFGTTSAEASLDARGNSETSFWATTFSDSDNSQYTMRRAGGTSAAPTAVATQQNIGSFSFRGHNGADFTGSRALIAAATEQGWTATANGTRITFGTTQNGTTTLSTRMTIKNDGKVGIGTTAPQDQLEVSGGNIRVTGGSFIDDGTTLNVPDYVFEPEYKLMRIEDLAAFIEREKHLPNVPNRDEVKSKGLNLSQFQMRLLEKVEELTLYTVAQHEQIEALSTQNEELQARLAALEHVLATVPAASDETAQK